MSGFEARLRTITGAALIDRLATYTVEELQYPAVLMDDGADEVTNVYAGTLQIKTEIRVQVIVKVGPGAPASEALDLWRGKVRQAIGTYSDEAAGVESVVYNRTDPPGRVTEEALPTWGQNIFFLMTRVESESDPYAI